MRFTPKMDNLNRSDSQTLSVNLTGLNPNSIIGESMNDSHSLGSLQSKEREQMIKLSAEAYNQALLDIAINCRKNAEAFGCTDEEVIQAQIKEQQDEFKSNHEVKGGKHQDFIHGQAREILDRMELDRVLLNKCTKSDGLVGKNDAIISCGLIFKLDSSTETTDETDTEPVETEENEKTK